jgi:hypothetical protein
LANNLSYSLDSRTQDKSKGDEYVKGCQFAIVYKYIDDEKKSDRMSFKNESNANAKATDFINGLEKYLRNICQTIIIYDKSGDERADNYITGLFDELKMIRNKSGHSLAQSLSTKINRYDNKALITAIHDALQRGVSLETVGGLLAQNYSTHSASPRGYTGGLPKYKEYLDRQKAINSAGR